MIDLESFLPNLRYTILQDIQSQPWEIVDNLESILSRLEIPGSAYKTDHQVAIHKTAIIERGVTLKGVVVVSENCFIGAHAYIRGPVFLGKSVKIGPGSEVKQSIIFDHSALAHFNYVGNSIVGQNVNFEAGSICANHYNEREDKKIVVKYRDQLIETNTEKFGSLIGDNTKIGANAVLSPGTILEMNSIVRRLELIEQTK